MCEGLDNARRRWGVNACAIAATARLLVELQASMKSSESSTIGPQACCGRWDEITRSVLGKLSRCARCCAGLAWKFGVTCVLLRCAWNSRYSPIVVRVERRDLYGRRILVGDLYEREEEGEFVWGQRLGALFTTESDCGQEPGCVRRAGAWCVVGWADSEVWGMWTMGVLYWPLPRVQERRGPADPGYYCGVGAGGKRRVVPSCQLPTKQKERRAAYSKFHQYTRNTCPSSYHGRAVLLGAQATPPPSIRSFSGSTDLCLPSSSIGSRGPLYIIVENHKTPVVVGGLVCTLNLCCFGERDLQQGDTERHAHNNVGYRYGGNRPGARAFARPREQRGAIVGWDQRKDWVNETL